MMPTVWFRLPPGFYDIGPDDRAALEAMGEALGGPEAQLELSQLMNSLDELADHHVVHTAIGLHPDEPVGVSTSLFSLTLRSADHPSPRTATAQTAVAIARSGMWTRSTRRFLDLPSSLPCCLVAGNISVPGLGRELFQARVVTAHPSGSHVLVLDLTSAATHHADAYTEIIGAVTHTLSFSDPSPGPAPPSEARTSRILEVLL
ncbi:hypothetical protein [Streptomyces sp. MJM1172]|uniref:hypothetical protein n=1 Tax=Streptomyces sp. MJM1172 TaxID=1703926 RepID=UPI00093DD492|nr:hypothetical protein [Streptomyces sp. MJM1172]OKI71189.1 hypothetical protein AMK15_00535 [Streptomyces sp. MJM1172]